MESVQKYQTALLNEDLPEDESLVEEPSIDEEDVLVAGIQYNEPVVENDSEKEINNLANNPKPEVKQPVKKAEAIPDYNMIVIPKMGVKAVINEGANANTLSRGIWRMPQGSNPEDGGNTVITAHRYMYRPPDPRTFFLIDKLVPGDTFYVYWEGEKYNYKVRETKIVDPSEVSILYNTSTNQVTLFSCTPLFTSEKRLVVIADEL